MSASETLSALEHKAHIETDRMSTFTEYRITGGLNEVLVAIKELFIQYHPYAYGTRLKQMEHLSDGSYGAVMFRGNSGD